MTDTGPTRADRDLVWVRGRGMCELDGCLFGLQVHHRLPRQMGGSRHNPNINLPSNLALLGDRCHRLVERYRTHAYATGWLIERTTPPTDPAAVPVLHAWHGRVYLRPDGSVQPVNGRATA